MLKLCFITDWVSAVLVGVWAPVCRCAVRVFVCVHYSEECNRCLFEDVCVCVRVRVYVNLCVRIVQDSSQIGLLKELLDLQKDMVVSLLSLRGGESSSTE